MNIPKGEFWFEAPKSQEMANAISEALEEAGVKDPFLIGRVWETAVDFRVRKTERGRDTFWNSTPGYLGERPDVKVNFKEKISLDISVEEPVWESPQVGSRWEGGLGGEYILAEVGERGVALISLERGSKYQNIVHVKSLTNITKAEWEAISRGGEFTPKV